VEGCGEVSGDVDVSCAAGAFQALTNAPEPHTQPPTLTTHPLTLVCTAQLGAAAGIFYGYTFLLSAILWGVMRFIKGEVKLVNMWCIYGG
jgi:hypothetical protein